MYPTYHIRSPERQGFLWNSKHGNLLLGCSSRLEVPSSHSQWKAEPLELFAIRLLHWLFCIILQQWFHQSFHQSLLKPVTDNGPWGIAGCPYHIRSVVQVAGWTKFQKVAKSKPLYNHGTLPLPPRRLMGWRPNKLQVQHMRLDNDRYGHLMHHNAPALISSIDPCVDHDPVFGRLAAALWLWLCSSISWESIEFCSVGFFDDQEGGKLGHLRTRSSSVTVAIRFMDQDGLRPWGWPWSPSMRWKVVKRQIRSSPTSIHQNGRSPSKVS